MRNRFISGMITGGFIGATAGMYAYRQMSPLQRKRMVKRGSKMMHRTANILDMMQSIHLLK